MIVIDSHKNNHSNSVFDYRFCKEYGIVTTTVFYNYIHLVG